MADDQRTANVQLTASTQQYSQQMAGAATATDRVTASVNSLLTSIQNLQKSTARKLEIISAGTAATIAGATVAASQFQRQMSSLDGTAAAAGRSTQLIGDTVDSLRRSLPMTTEQVIGLVSALQKMGTTQTNMKSLVTTITQLSSVTGEDVGSLATGIVGLGRSMGTTEQAISGFADTLTALSTKLGVSASGVLSFSQSLAPVARSVNMTQNDVMGFSAAFSKAGQDGYAAANVFTSMLSNISRAARYGSQDLAMYANLAGTTVDAFKSMGSTQQIVAVLGAINKAGPDALRTLDQMGIDAPRAVKAVQGVVQSGGLQQALSLANGDNSGLLSKGSKTAMDGLQDNLEKLKNTMTSLTQAFGAAFLGPATDMVKVLDKIANAVHDLLAPFAGLIALLTTAGGLLSGIGGGIVSGFGVLSAAGTAMMLARSSPVAGFVNARNQRLGRSNAPWVDNRLAANQGQSGIFGAFSRGSQQAGAFMAGRTPGGRLDRLTERYPSLARFTRDAEGEGGSSFGAVGRNIGDLARSLPARGAMLASTGVQGFMNTGRSFISPLEWSRARGRVAQPGEEFRGMGRAFGSVFSSTGGENAPSMSRAMSEAASSTGRFVRSLGSATAGLGSMVAQLGGAGLGMTGAGLGGAARGAGRLASRAFGGLSGALGMSPVGLGITAGIGGATLIASQISGAKQQHAQFSEDISGVGATDTAYDKYANSLGLAGAAAESFANTVQSAATKISQSAGAQSIQAAQTVTAADQALAGTLKNYSNADVGKMSQQQATAYAATVFAGPDSAKNPQIMQAMKLDLVKRFGSAQAAQQIINTASNNTVDMSAMIQGGWGNSWIWNGSEGKQDRWKQLQSLTDTERAGISTTLGDTTPQGQTENAKLTASQLNALLQEYPQAQTLTDRANLGSSIEAALGVQQGSLKLSNTDADRLQTAAYSGDLSHTQDVLKDIISSVKSPEGQDALNKLSQIMGLDTTDRTATSYTINTSSPTSPLAVAQRGNAAGVMYYGATPLSTQLQAAVASPDDSAKTDAAARAWAAQLVQQTGTLQGAEAALDKFKANIGSSSDIMYQLADAARVAAQRLQTAADSGVAHAPAYAAGQARQQLVEAYNIPISDPNRGTTLQGAEDTYNQQRQAFTQQLQSEATQLQSYNIQRSRAETQFDLQRERSTSDYYLSVQRSEDNYEKQKARGQADFDLQQSQSLADYTKSRLRSEEDFQHQLQEMTKQTAQSMANIYQKTAVKPAWDAQNLLANAQEQNAQLSQQQANLTQLRKMGVSGDVIQQLGLNDPQNAQQLAKFVSDLGADPKLVKQWNDAIKGRLSLAKAFTTDNDNETYKEMTYQFDKSADRAADDFKTMTQRANTAYQTSTTRMEQDFNLSMNQGHDDFMRQMARNNTDFNTQMTQMEDDLQRSFTTVTGTIDQLATTVLSQLHGTAKQQLADTLAQLKTSSTELETQLSKAQTSLQANWNSIFGNGANAAPQYFRTDPYNTAPPLPGLSSSSTAAAAKSPSWTFTATPGTGGGGPQSNEGPGSLSAEHSALLNPTSGAHGAGGHPADFGKYPLPSEGVWTSGFGMRMNPVLHRWMLHAGQDIATPVGTRVASVRDGVVSKAGYFSGSGNLVVISHGNGLSTEYMHLSRIEVKPGDHVSEGQEIALSGNTGNSTGPHLHFQTDYNGTPRNPASFLEQLAHASGFSAPPRGSGTTGTKTATDTNPKASPADITKELSTIAKIMTPVEQAQEQVPGLSRYIPPGLATSAVMALTMVKGQNAGWFGDGAVFSGPKTIGVGERGPEAVIPLNQTGADFILNLFNKYTGLQPRGSQTVPASTNYYSQSVDSSVNFSGAVTVKADDPADLARQLEAQARLKALVSPRA